MAQYVNENLYNEKQLHDIAMHIINLEIPDSELGKNLLDMYHKSHTVKNLDGIVKDILPLPYSPNDAFPAAVTLSCTYKWLLNHNTAITQEVCPSLACDMSARLHYEFFHDEDNSRIVLKGGNLIHQNYRLMCILLSKFRECKKKGRDIDYIPVSILAEMLGINEFAVYEAIRRLREALALGFGLSLSCGKDLVENRERDGYRLGARLKEIMALVDFED